MNENEINKPSSMGNALPDDEWNGQMSDMRSASPLAGPQDDEEQHEGFSFKWVNLLIGAAVCLWWFQGSDGLSVNWSFYLYLAVVVVIHELGHVIAGKSFGCLIKEMQVFFLPFVSYKSKHHPGGSSWRDIKWSLGTLPLGGVTIFKSRVSDDDNDSDSLGFGSPGWERTSAASPYIEDKPAWQRLLISAAGVLFNIATFLILYVAMPYMSLDWNDFFWPLVSLSLIVAVLNILPIYPLDGGAIVFALFEIITGKKPSPGFTQACGWIGFILIVLFFWVFPEWLDSILDSVFRKFF